MFDEDPAEDEKPEDDPTELENPEDDPNDGENPEDNPDEDVKSEDDPSVLENPGLNLNRKCYNFICEERILFLFDNYRRFADGLNNGDSGVP